MKVENEVNRFLTRQDLETYAFSLLVLLQWRLERQLNAEFSYSYAAYAKVVTRRPRKEIRALAARTLSTISLAGFIAWKRKREIDEFVGWVSERGRWRGAEGEVYP